MLLREHIIFILITLITANIIILAFIALQGLIGSPDNVGRRRQ